MTSRLITRFAPSPTGSLHIGGVRTALYCWLLARRFQGSCILRIEDTDRERSTRESEAQILDSFAWLEMEFDGLYRQSDRFNLYSGAVDDLLARDKAYVCECSSERLDKLRDAQLAAKEKPRYDGACRGKGLTWRPGRVVRLATPREGVVSFADVVFGPISVANAELDDMVVRRGDGSCTYNFCCAVDDHAMGITTVIRGDDHINNTPRQIHVYQALGYDLPQFAHLPMILGEDGKRLSKRHGAQGVLDYRDAGLLPDAVINYLARLGWSLGDQEVFTRGELITGFSLDRVSRSPGIFSTEKLAWVNKQHLKQGEAADLLPHLRRLADLSTLTDTDLLPLIEALRERVDTLGQLLDELAPYISEAITVDPEAQVNHLGAEALPVLERAREVFAGLDWRNTDLHQTVRDIAEQLGVKMGKVGMPLRVAVTGRGFSPALELTLELIGRERVLARLDAAIARLKHNP